MALLSIRLLGTLQVTLAGEPVRGFESDKVRALLAYLAVEVGHPHRREKLAGLLWPERPEKAARANLRQALSNLRRAVGDAQTIPPFFEVTRQTIQFNRASDAWIDAVALADLLSTDADPPRLEAAIDLYRGHLLEGFSPAGSAPFEEWVLLTREQLARQVLLALRRVVAFHTDRGAHEQALHYVWRQLELEPWEEQGHRQAMRLLAALGQHKAALSQYGALRQTLSEELGVEPEDRTTALYREIQGGFRRALQPRRPPHNLPALLTPFVGRTAELAAIQARLQEPGCRVLTLLGPGGSGKTHLALKAAWEMLSQGRAKTVEQGIYFVALAALQSPQAIVPAVAEAVGLALQETGKPEQQLFDFFDQKRMLLILDNLEHLLPAVGWIVELLRSVPNIRLLVTSQARLNLQAEHVFRLGGMELPDQELLASGGSVKEIAGYGSIALFADGAARVRPDFRLTASNAPHIVRICQLVDGLPLGILLAAAWTEKLTPLQIAARLSADLAQGLDLLEAGWQDVPERQRSMRAILAHSWRLLSRREREILENLAVFAGGFTRRAAAEVARAQSRDLQALLHRSLLSRSEASRYKMHELLRQYAAERLAQRPPAAHAAGKRHGRYYAHALRCWAADLRGEGQPGPGPATALAEMQTEIQNAQAAWRWAAERADVEKLEQAAEGLCLFFEWQARYAEGEAACRLAAERLAETTPQTSRVLRLLARLLAWQGAFAHHLAGPEGALALLDRCLGLLKTANLADEETRPERALALWHRGRVLDSFDRQGARKAYEECLALYREDGDPWGMANALAALGGVAWNLGDYDLADQHHRASLALRRLIGDKRGIAHSLMAVGVTSLYQGELTEAEGLVREGCALRQELGDLRGMADSYRHLGVTLLLLGAFADASSLLERSVAIYADLGLRFGLEVAMLGEAQLHLGNYDAAQDQVRVALALARSTGYRRGLGYSRLVGAQVALAQDDYATAHGLAQESCQTYAEIGQWEEHCRALVVLGYARRGLGLRPWAAADLHDELQKAAVNRAFIPLLWGLPALALLLADSGQTQRAAEAYSLAMCYPAVARSRWLEDVVGRQLEGAGVASSDAQQVAGQAVSKAGRLAAEAGDLGAAVQEVLAWIGPGLGG